MRIAVSGTHGVGKSTLIEEFLSAHPDFAHEPEPYSVLVEDFGEEFSAEPSVDDFQRQLVFNLDRLTQHGREERVIYERCPIDFLAYIAALDSRATNAALNLVANALQHLDLVLYLPITTTNSGELEFPKLRKAVDQVLSAVYRDCEFGLVSSTDLVIVEATGPTAERLRTLEAAMRQLRSTV